LDPKQVTVVEAHGTGTLVGDPAEYDGVPTVFGGSMRSNKLSLGSVKGLVGHTESASGIVALLKTLLMILEDFIPPQPSFQTINPNIKAMESDNIEISTHLKQWNVDFRAALINNYGASGSNASLIVTQAPVRQSTVAVKSFSSTVIKHKYPFWFCGLDEQALRRYVSKLRNFLHTKSVPAKSLDIANLSFQLYLQSNRALGHALILSCVAVDDLDEKLAAFEFSPVGAQTLRPPAARSVILCFGGQVSNYIGLDQQFYGGVAIFRSHMDHCNAICQSLGLEGIFPMIFQKEPIESIVKLQITLLSLQYSCAKSWIESGV